MTDYSFIGHPFKKSFPLLGNVELYYSELDKHTKYKIVDSAELLRVFMLVFKVWY